MRNILRIFIAFIVIASGQALSPEKKRFYKISIIISFFFTAALLIFQTQAIAQVIEGYIPGNLGRIVEICNDQGLLPEFHTLIGYDSNGSVKASNSTSAYKIFARYPNQTLLNPPNDYSGFNYYGRFGAPRVHDSYEIRFGTDSSRYWIRPGNFLNGGTLAPNKLPFSVYNVGYRPAGSRDTSGGIKLCMQVQDQDNNGIYTPGERIAVYGDLTLPFDSTYDVFGNMNWNLFSSSNCYFSNFRTGLASVSYDQSTFTVPGDGISPPAGTVIRLVSAGSDTAIPIIFAPGNIFAPNHGIHEFSLGIYSYEVPSLEIIESPSYLIIQDSKLIWNNINPYGMSHDYTIRATNTQGYSQKTRLAFSGYRTTEKYSQVRLDAGKLIFYTRNNGNIAFHADSGLYGLRWRPDNSGLVFASGFYIGTLKKGRGGHVDTVTVSDTEFYSEFQPGRILNTGPLGSLITEDPNAEHTGVYVLPDHTSIWPPEAPRNEAGLPLQLSNRDTWTVFNDMSVYNNPHPYSPAPKLGIECQRQTFQFHNPPFDKLILVRQMFINKSNRNYDSTYFGLWMDADVGAVCEDDRVDIDTNTGMIYLYSSTADSLTNVIGQLFLQTPITVSFATDTARIKVITVSGFYTKNIAGQKNVSPSGGNNHFYNGEICGPGGPSIGNDDIGRYYTMQGLDCDGLPKPYGPFQFYYNIPMDQRTVFGCGPFRFALGDTQSVWYAFVAGTGTTHQTALDSLIQYAHRVKNIFDNDLNSVVIGITEPSSFQARSFTLFSNYPNPFNPSTVIRYQLAVSNKVTLKIYNILGQEVRKLVNKKQSAGMHSVVWDGKNNRGQRVSSGVYLYRLEAGDFVKTRKMVLVK